MSWHYDYPLEYTCLSNMGPRSFLFYIVANIGPAGAHRPLAVALRQGDDVQYSLDFRVRRVVGDTMRLVRVLSEPANRIALEAKMELAAAWYRSSDHETHHLQRPEVPDVIQPQILAREDSPFCVPRPELPWSHVIREFPFISTCLILGLTDDPVNRTRPHDVQLQPLTTAFRDDRYEYGMVVLDISDLDDIGYGIVAFPIHYMAEAQMNQHGYYDLIEGVPLAREPDIVLTEYRPRLPLSAVQYTDEFPYQVYGPELADLKTVRLVDVGTLDYAIGTTISQTQDTNNSNSVAYTPPGLAKLQRQLLTQLLEIPGNLRSSDTLSQLLRLAYAGHAHINCVALENITYEAIAAAIESDELKNAYALSLCIDNISGDPKALVAALSQSMNLVQLCFLQHPDRETDDASAQLFKLICASSSKASDLSSSTTSEKKREDTTTEAQANWFQNRKITLTCAFSAPLREMPWLPYLKEEESMIPACAFPVTHMFVRRQLDFSEIPKFQPDYHFVGDALLSPERFAVGFLSYIRSIQTDRYLLSFALGPPTLEAYAAKSARLVVSPVPAESFCMAQNGGGKAVRSENDGTAQTEYNPNMRDVEAGSWVVLITVEEYVNPEESEAARREWKDPWGYPTHASFSRYAFFRARRRMPMSNFQREDETSAAALDALVGPASLEVVGGLQEFLHETAPHIDAAFVKRLLSEVEKDMARKTVEASGIDQLAVLGPDDARAVFRDFIQTSMVHSR
ncbi:hypothetical protein G7Z17_g4465 [Cylindrodendrum hubeiense]|uniref:Uncharacterized protein n=1 Tax=Cylindrodendrum hubeiense TaxID=595255 RepID=A0A9P5H8T9_9HYPO|nr:hypothetical protein G7Z17_g4465 [Cylindrodendrum hubeiense]